MENRSVKSSAKREKGVWKSESPKIKKQNNKPFIVNHKIEEGNREWASEINVVLNVVELRNGVIIRKVVGGINLDKYVVDLIF